MAEQDLFLEIKPGYMIPLTAIQGVQWKDGNLRIAYNKGDGNITTVEVEDIRGSATFMYEQLRRLAITYETGPEFDAEDEL